jgi:hypothetical protein
MTSKLKRGAKAKRHHLRGSIAGSKGHARHDRRPRHEGGGPVGDPPSISTRSDYIGPPSGGSSWLRDAQTMNMPSAPRGMIWDPLGYTKSRRGGRQ